MTTITKEWLQQTIAEFENTRDDIPFGLDDDDAKILKVLKQALASLDAEPVRYLNKFSGTCVTLEQQPNAADDVAVYMPLYAAPPVQETGIYKDMLNIISLLEKNEWAEHCTSTVLGSLLESEITRLVGKEQSAPVIPDGWVACSERMPEAGDDMIVFTDDIVMSGVSYSKKKGFYLQALEYDDDEPVDNVTHWMPLPAAPQQEGK
ncbi:DUF551 domain-containing protein [Salmonella enterica subsp. enterica serovar Isangi]|nr:DUF551 domain-containing protein [Salmonella enterica]ECS2301620.1 DUF551 domain-containing protein [Salmonella enterica subsp. enterica serovar Isangi]ECS2307105.1 DUF551 domain-containing protein [Salmonella enterica subsp. enterica serovar Isangi]ECT5203627.1 DUF551 domain-containing protein [Salmonella enterica subsp. enterica serovar Isangi]ECT5265059.1 DUF551 domain-containing protein [Salmonella enterica subsp. enterica serovar Isangi]